MSTDLNAVTSQHAKYSEPLPKKSYRKSSFDTAWMADLVNSALEAGRRNREPEFRRIVEELAKKGAGKKAATKKASEPKKAQPASKPATKTVKKSKK